MDAAVATSLVLGVVAPAFSGIGGGGFFMVHLKDEETLYIDYRETAPQARGREHVPAGRCGAVRDSANSVGYRSVGVPGTIAGLSYALENYGNLKFAEVASQAIAFARHGFEVSPFLGAIMSNEVRDTIPKIHPVPRVEE